MWSKERRQKASLARKKAWARGLYKRAPAIGTKRQRNGKIQIRTLSPKGWFYWKNESRSRDYSKFTDEELLKLPRSTRSELRLKGIPIPMFRKGVPRGYKQTQAHKDKRRQAIRKYLFDMTTLDRDAKQRVRQSYEYMRWREAVFVRDNWTCQECNRRNGNGEEVYLEAHHVKPYTKYPKLRFIVSNGVTLCKNCHKNHTSHEMKGNKNGHKH